MDILKQFNEKSIQFENLPTNIKKMLYISSIYSKLYNKGNQELSSSILNNYNKVLFNIGIIGRKEIGSTLDININKYISSIKKGILKKEIIRRLIVTYNVFPNSIIYFDDNSHIIDTVKSLGVIAIQTPNFLDISLLQELLVQKQSISMVLTDFSMTLLTKDIKQREWNINNIDKMINIFFGGKERLNKLTYLFKQLEENGIKTGIITFQSSKFAKNVLRDVEMID